LVGCKEWSDAEKFGEIRICVRTCLASFSGKNGIESLPVYEPHSFEQKTASLPINSDKCPRIAYTSETLSSRPPGPGLIRKANTINRQKDGG